MSFLLYLCRRPENIDTPLFAVFNAKKDERCGTGFPGVPGLNVVPIEQVTADWLADLQRRSVEAGQHVWWRGGLRDPDGNFAGTWALWCDIDMHGPGQQNAAEKMAAVQRFNPAPSYIFFSGRGYHLVWLLDNFCTDPQLVKSKLVGLAHVLDGDPKPADSKNGGLRVEGTINWKVYNPQADSRSFYCHILAGADPPAAYSIHLFPDGVKSSKQIKAEGKKYSNCRELFYRYVGDQVPDPTTEKWHVRCPFHDDTTASLTINVEMGAYICGSDSCSAKSGTIAKFYSLIEGVDYATALRALDHLKPAQSLVDVLEQLLRTRCKPLYWEGASIWVVECVNGELGRQVEIRTGSPQSIREALAILFSGSPAVVASELIGDDAKLNVLNAALTEAALQLGKDLGNVDDLQLLGPGIHAQLEQPMMVNANRLHRWHGNAWVKLEDVVEEPYALACGISDAPVVWYPTPTLTLKRDLGELANQKLEMLKYAWHFRQDRQDDPYWMALYTLYLSAWTMFGTPIHLQISGPSQSGKSALSAGWFGGYLEEAVQMAAGCRYVTSATAAGIYQNFNHWKLPIVFDEVLDHNDFRAKQLIELIRNMEAGSAEVLRGNAEGRRGRKYNASMPTIWSSIRVPDEIQDMNRRLHIELPRIGSEQGTEPPPNPWQKIRKRWSTSELRQLGRLSIELMLAEREGLLRSMQELREELTSVKTSSYRMATRMVPLLAIARRAGWNVSELVDCMGDRVAAQEASTMENAPHEVIRQHILYGRIQQPGGVTDTTLLDQINSASTYDFRAVHVGLYYWRDEQVIGIVPNMFLRHLQQQSKDGWSGNQIGRQLKNIPGYLKVDYRRLEGSPERVHLLDAKRVVGRDKTATNGVSHAPGLGAGIR